MRNILLIVLGIIVGVVGVMFATGEVFGPDQNDTDTNSGSAPFEVTSFEECVSQGNPVMDRYPRKCVHNGVTFIEAVDAGEEPFFENGKAAKDFDDCVERGNPVTKTFPRICIDENGVAHREDDSKIKETVCTSDSRSVKACNELYAPVCARVQVECFVEPCDPVPQTFGNSCEACKNNSVISYTEGECSG